MGLVGLVVVFVFNSIKNLHNPIFLWGKKRKENITCFLEKAGHQRRHDKEVKFEERRERER